MFNDYWLDVFREDIDRIIEIKTEQGELLTMNELKAQFDKYMLVDRCDLRVAEYKGKLIGFMFYHYIFESILIVRGIYFVKEFRKSFLMRSITMSVGHIVRGFSQTFKGVNQPEELKGEKPNRKLIHNTKDMMVWENIVRPRSNLHGRSTS